MSYDISHSISYEILYVMSYVSHEMSYYMKVNFQNKKLEKASICGIRGGFISTKPNLFIKNVCTNNIKNKDFWRMT